VVDLRNLFEKNIIIKGKLDKKKKVVLNLKSTHSDVFSLFISLPTGSFFFFFTFVLIDVRETCEIQSFLPPRGHLDEKSWSTLKRCFLTCGANMNCHKNSSLVWTSTFCNASCAQLLLLLFSFLFCFFCFFLFVFFNLNEGKGSC
jgi:hypothetical protein